MTRRNFYFAITCLSLCIVTNAHAGLQEPVYVIDAPTAGILGHGEYLVQTRIGPESSFLSSLRLGIRDVANVGISFGMQRVFERADITVNDQVGFQLQLRLIPETTVPAVAVGFNNQGVGRYDETLDRYERKSKGFYLVVSKNWQLLVGQMSLHGGLNYSMEREDQESVNAFAAAEFEVTPGLSLVGDVDGALDDKLDSLNYGGGGIYVDMGIRVHYGENLSMMLLFRDLSGNYKLSNRVGREFEIAFVDLF